MLTVFPLFYRRFLDIDTTQVLANENIYLSIFYWQYINVMIFMYVCICKSQTIYS